VTSIYQHPDYKSFIKAAFAARENKGRGQRLKLAEFLGCQDSYVSLVLGGDRHFSVEQGEGVARFLLLDEEETETFLFLLLRDRAGTEAARKYFTSRLQEKEKRYLDLRKRVKIESDLSDAEKMYYYASPLPAKVHMLLTIPGGWTAEKLARRFRTSNEKMSEVCKFLVAKGLIRETAGKLHGASKFLFLDKQSPFLSRHHGNWRLDALQTIQEKKDEGMHLSMTITLSEKDAEELRHRIAHFIQETSSFIKDSKEETLMAFCLDYYRP
jgi:uncharacterized protein (TIGR02147 family)